MLSCLCRKSKDKYDIQQYLPFSSNETMRFTKTNSEVKSDFTQNSQIRENGQVLEESAKDAATNQEEKRRSGIAPAWNYDENSIQKNPKFSKELHEEKLIRSALEYNEFLNKIIKGKLLQNVVGAMYNRDVSAEETIIKEGEKGAHLYVSAKGEFEISINGNVESTFNDTRVFGELAILYSAKRMATIRALTPGRVWVLDGAVFQQLLVRSNIKEQDQTLNFLQNIPILNTAGSQVLQKVANLLKAEFYSTGTVIVKQGDKGDKFFIVRAGTVTISKEGEGVVSQFRKGQFFGELALLKVDQRQATVTADSPGVECLTLTKQQFIDHFGDVDVASIPVAKSSDFHRNLPEYSDVDVLDLNVIGTLGVGGFGRVELVQHKQRRELVFALKSQKKIDVVEQHQEEHVFNEKNIQIACKSTFIVRLYRTYKNSKYIYFLMEACLGGDLWTLLQNQKTRRFEEKDAKFIAACVLEAFAYLHHKNIVYRDLKPENLMIDKEGYIKLTDFGFAKKLGSRGKTYTFAGTPEYVAPEIVLNRGHDKAVDYWAFGAFIFELLTGRTPFRSNDPTHMRTYNKILNGIDSVEFPTFVAHKSRHIIEKLLRPIPTERLGCQKNGIRDVRNHKWFTGLDWDRLNEKKLPAPFKPKLRNAVDMQHFERFKKDYDEPPDETSGWDEDF